MQLTLYKTNSPTNSVNKVLTDPLIININLKRETDVLDPEITLVALPGVDYLQYNYAYIDGLNRYYTIDSVDSVNARLWKLSLAVDVLMTYKTQIMTSTCRYKRKVMTGDYFVDGLNKSSEAVITKHESTVTIDDTVHSNVLTVVEGGELN